MKDRIPAVLGWLSIDPAKPRLIGTRCTACSSVFFPRENVRCRNPRCGRTELTEVELSPRGKLWSYTNSGYQPPEPYVPRTSPFVPFALAAVELGDEKMVILGQVADGFGVDDLKVGMEMELTLGTLFEDDKSETITWQWKPAGQPARQSAKS